jgi:hypothetical protein
MRRIILFPILIVLLMLVFHHPGSDAAVPMGTAWTYQSRLMDANGVADGLYHFKFKLFDDPNVGEGNQVGSSVNVEDVDVIDGYFTVALDFGSKVFNGDARWLEISVHPPESAKTNAFVTLSPRQEIAAVPYALQIPGIFVDDTGHIGIHTAKPAELLHVHYGGIRISRDDAQFIDLVDNSAAGGFITSHSGQRNKKPLYIQSLYDNQSLHESKRSPACETGILFRTGNALSPTDAMCITENGNIGIGTISPSSSLHIQDAHATIRLQDEYDPLSYTVFEDAGPSMFTIQKNTDTGFSLLDLDAYPRDGTSDSAIRFFRHTNTTGLKRVVFVRGDGTSTADAQIGVDGSNSFFNGNVGIGTTNPECRLHISGNSRSTPTLLMESTDAPEGAQILTLFAGASSGDFCVGRMTDSGKSLVRTDLQIQARTGNVGIGTSSPDTKLEVDGGPIKATGGLIIETRTSDPVNPVTGQIWLRTDIP